MLPGTNGRYFVPDFIVRHPETGQVLAVESKFGPGARFTQGQLTGYDHLAGRGRIQMRSAEAAQILREEGVIRVDAVVTYRWNTEIVPDAALRAEADAIAAARDALR
jgi:hypothetical protein